MRYNAGTDGRVHLPKLLGIYERELNGWLEQACALNFPLIIDVGAAEGYYAIGMALRNPKARVIAFEAESKSRVALGEKARLNNVESRVEICGKCEPEDLKRALMGTQRPFLICDVEGYEAVLLNPAAVLPLRRAFILVELHEFIENLVDAMRHRKSHWCSKYLLAPPHHCCR